MTTNVKLGKNSNLPVIEQRGLFPAEINALIKAPHHFLTIHTKQAVKRADMHELLIRLIFDTWAREDEIRMVRVEDIDIENRLLTLKNTKFHIVKRTEEGEYITDNEPRTVDFSEDTKKLLIRYLEGRRTGFLFRGHKKRAISTRTIRYIVNQYSQKLGIQRIVGKTKDGRNKYLLHPHAIREAGEAFSILLSNMDRKTAAIKAGHSMRVQEKYYTRYHAVRARIASDKARRTLQEQFGGG